MIQHTRRAFLAQTSAAAAGLALSGLAPVYGRNSEEAQASSDSENKTESKDSTFDRIFKNAVDIHGKSISLAVRDGRFAAIDHSLDASQAGKVTDLQGRLVLPGFIDGHIHLDKTFVGGRWHSYRSADSLSGRLAIEKEELAQASPVIERAEALIAQAAAYGTVGMRCQVDVDATTGLSNLHAVMKAREKWRDVVDMELVAFPQAGVVRSPGTAKVLDAAVQEGAEVIGGIDPSVFDGNAKKQLDAVFGIAERRGAKIDIHLHEPKEQGIETLMRIAARTSALGMEKRVAASHAYCLGEVSDAQVDRAANALARAAVSIMTNAPGVRSMPPVLRLHKAGVHVFGGSDNIRDAWWPYGNGDMLERAMLIGYISGLYTDEELLLALNMITNAGATVLGKFDYGLATGNEATFVAVDALNGPAAVAGVPCERMNVKRGEVWHQSGAAKALLKNPANLGTMVSKSQ